MRSESKRTDSTGFVQATCVCICLLLFAVGIVALPAARLAASATRGSSAGPVAEISSNVEQRLLANPGFPARLPGAGTVTQRLALDVSREDPDLPPFIRGLDKAEYLRLRAEHLSLLRGVPYTTSSNPRAKAIREMERQIARNAPNISPTNWTPIGPAPIPNGQTAGVSTPVSGRTISIAVHPTNPNIVYAGTAQGGLYRTLDGGATWTAIFDSALSLAIGAVAIAPSSPSTVFVGTGEAGLAIDSYFGVGVYRIDNADTAPTLNGPFNSDGVGDIFTGRSISELVVHPTDPNIIFVGSTFGIGGVGVGVPPVLPAVGLYRSTNALSGSPTFAKLNVPTGAVPPRNITDIVLEPDNPSNLVCAVMGNVGANDGGIWRTTNALDATPVFTRTQTLGTVVGNPDIRIELAINKVGSTVTVYAATGEPMQVGSLCQIEGRRGALRKSTDGGATFTGGPAPGSALDDANSFCGFQCFYNIAVAVDPANANIMYLGGQDTSGCSKIVKKSTDGGMTFVTNDSGLHADTHAITVAPSDSSIIYLGGDGGIYKSTDTGATWTSLNNSGFSATQFQSLAVHPTDQFFTIGGTQDNGTNFQKPDNTWTRADFGDGGFALIDQNAADNTNVTMYHTYANSTSAHAYARVTNTASAVDGGWSIFGCGGGATPNGMTCAPAPTAVLFYAPMALGPGSPNTLYFGTDRLWRSADSGTNMSLVSQGPFVASQPITAIGISPQNDNVRIVGLRNGKVFRTTTGSSPLTDVTGPIPANYVARAVIDPANVDTAYVALNGFGLAAGQHIWKTTNLSNAPPTWTAAGGTGGNVIPDVPVNAFVVDASDPTLPGVSVLYAGTDIGVYRSTDGGTNWLPFGVGLPRVAVFDMAIQQLHRFLRIATHGRGMWEIALPGSPTAATVEDSTATAYDDGRVLLEWKSGVEVDNLGYNVYREEKGNRVRITPELLAGSALVAGPGTTLTGGKSYAWADSLPNGAHGVRYWLEDVDLRGKSTWHGPVEPRRSAGGSPSFEQAVLLSKLGLHQAQLQLGLGSVPVQRSAKLGAAGPARMQNQTSLASQQAVKLWVKREGLYQVTQPELVAAGLDPNADPRYLQMFVEGSEVAITVVGEKDRKFDASDFVEFYGVGLDTPASDTRVYWLTVGAQPGKRIDGVSGKGGHATSGGFPYTVERKDRTIYFSALVNGEAENFFGAVIAGQAVDQVLWIQHLNSGDGEPAIVEATLQGVTHSSHRVRLQLNGTDVGAVNFEGQSAGKVRLSVPSSLLREGENQVRLTAQNGQSDISLVDSIRITYSHSYVADSNELRLGASGGQEISVDGFTNGSIRLLDITDPNEVQTVSATIKPTRGGYRITASVPGAGARLLLALADSEIKHPGGIAANVRSSWRGTGNGADLLIITQREFFMALGPLAALRQSQGLSVAVVDIEDVYDEFSFGNKTAQALKDFISFAGTSWKKKPKFALLAGQASYDPRNYLGYGESDIVPTKLIDTVYMETASDEWLADINGDEVADLAVGRLPCRTLNEASKMVRKITEYERSSPSGEVLLVADANDGYNFEAMSAELQGLIPSDLRITQLNRGQMDGVTAKSQLLEAIQRGQKIVNYTGHGNVNQWRGNLLTNEDASALTNADQLSLFVMMTCLNGYFADPALDSLAASMMKAESGGAVAVWASSGMTLPQGQTSANKHLLRSLFERSGDALTLGEAVKRAKSAVGDPDVRRTWVLFGDPAMKLR